MQGPLSMTDTQLYLAIGVPVLSNAVLFAILMAYVNARISGLENSVSARFDAINQRFDDMRDLWRIELRRVEEVLDARLKHIEEERGR
jgi:hypothetical protein